MVSWVTSYAANSRYRQAHLRQDDAATDQTHRGCMAQGSECHLTPVHRSTTELSVEVSYTSMCGPSSAIDSSCSSS